MAPTRYRPLGTPNNWLTSVVPKSASLLPLVTRIPVDSEINREGIWLTRPSPIVRIAYLFRALVISMPCLVIPMMIPPTILMVVIRDPQPHLLLHIYGTIHGTEKACLFLDFLSSLLCFRICNGSGVQIRINSHLLTGHCIQGKSRCYFRYTL